MGKIPDGILGPLVGTIANVTGYVLSGPYRSSKQHLYR